MTLPGNKHNICLARSGTARQGRPRPGEVGPGAARLGMEWRGKAWGRMAIGRAPFAVPSFFLRRLRLSRRLFLQQQALDHGSIRVAAILLSVAVVASLAIIGNEIKTYAIKF